MAGSSVETSSDGFSGIGVSIGSSSTGISVGVTSSQISSSDGISTFTSSCTGSSLSAVPMAGSSPSASFSSSWLLTDS